MCAPVLPERDSRGYLHASQHVLPPVGGAGAYAGGRRQCSAAGICSIPHAHPDCNRDRGRVPVQCRYRQDTADPECRPAPLCGQPDQDDDGSAAAGKRQGPERRGHGAHRSDPGVQGHPERQRHHHGSAHRGNGAPHRPAERPAHHQRQRRGQRHRLGRGRQPECLHPADERPCRRAGLHQCHLYLRPRPVRLRQCGLGRGHGKDRGGLRGQRDLCAGGRFHHLYAGPDEFPQRAAHHQQLQPADGRLRCLL